MASHHHGHAQDMTELHQRNRQALVEIWMLAYVNDRIDRMKNYISPGSDEMRAKHYCDIVTFGAPFPLRPHRTQVQRDQAIADRANFMEAVRRIEDAQGDSVNQHVQDFADVLTWTLPGEKWECAGN